MIEEIESRFTNPTPISDVTLKIVISNRIVAQLQLTVQTNAAAYHFAHKIYELQRTKVFSKLKIIHNYFQESNDDFSQLASKALKLLNSKSNISKDAANSIQRYFNLGSVNDKIFVDILPRVLEEKKAEVPFFANVVDPSLQDLMLGVFCIFTGVWYQSLGKIVNSALKNESLSPKLKSVLISCFLDQFQLPKESEYMQQLGITLFQLEKKIFMQEYIRVYFSIEKIFQYTSQNHRVFHRAQQLKMIKFSQYHSSGPIKLEASKFMINLLIEEHCLQNINRLRQMFNFYFVTRDHQKDTIYDEFSYYYSWIIAQLKSNKSIDRERLLISQIAIIKAQQLLEVANPKQASTILKSAEVIFKNREEQEKVIYCDTLLIECSIRTTKTALKDWIVKYNMELVKKAETLGIQLKGALYADSLWRISEYFSSIIKKPEDKQLLLQSFTKMAIRQMSRSKGKTFVKAITNILEYQKKIGNKQYELLTNELLQQKGKESLILVNEKINYARLQNLKTDGCFYLTLAKWKNLKKLYLSQNNIGDEGCQHLSKGKWGNLTNLDLFDNKIGPKGCLYLSTAKWDNLKQLFLWNNQIGVEGCKHLADSKWNNLIKLYIKSNKIRVNGCKQLSRATWDLTSLNISSNIIENEGCKYLAQAKWENLTSLILSRNKIGVEGCQHLSKSKWHHLSELILQQNSVGAEGCKHISSANWEHLSKLNLDTSNIGAQGCKYLSSAKWDHLFQLNLNQNNIGDEGCRHLSVSEWSNLTLLHLSRNHIGSNGCKHLSDAKWSSLANFNFNQNKFGSAGCRNLSNAKWENLSHLYMSIKTIY